MRTDLVPCAGGPLPMMRSPSTLIAGPPAAGRRFRIQLKRGDRMAVRLRRRLEVAEYLDGWVPLRIVDEHEQRRRIWLWLEAERPVSPAAAADFAKDCPGYVPGSFRMLDANGPQRAR